jgi:hypothetical protein
MTRRKKATADAPRTWGYCRVSTSQQATEGHSLSDQQSRIAGLSFDCPVLLPKPRGSTEDCHTRSEPVEQAPIRTGLPSQAKPKTLDGADLSA